MKAAAGEGAGACAVNADEDGPDSLSYQYCSAGAALQKRRYRSLLIFSESETLNFESANRKFADLQDRHGRRFLKVPRISGVELEARKSSRRRCVALQCRPAAITITPHRMCKCQGASG